MNWLDTKMPLGYPNRQIEFTFDLPFFSRLPHINHLLQGHKVFFVAIAHVALIGFR
jgi:hypothetical protein